uniref:Uncharacterized protein n=1 Tax=Eutreptiella gymnastica TaxID=73025 RepID=A0A7S1N5X3_9EUGL
MGSRGEDAGSRSVMELPGLDFLTSEALVNTGRKLDRRVGSNEGIYLSHKNWVWFRAPLGLSLPCAADNTWAGTAVKKDKLLGLPHDCQGQMDLQHQHMCGVVPNPPCNLPQKVQLFPRLPGGKTRIAKSG